MATPEQFFCSKWKVSKELTGEVIINGRKRNIGIL